jgi:hypothetical protein
MYFLSPNCLRYYQIFVFLLIFSHKKIIMLSEKIDKLTHSIENAISGDCFETEVDLFTKEDVKILVKTDWVFDWQKEVYSKDRTVYKLTITGNPDVIQGLISISDYKDHIFANLIENAKFNKGKSKLYLGVAGNLMAFACKVSFEKGYDGYVSFISKSKLITHYEKTLGAIKIGGLKMIIDTQAARKLFLQYFKM